MQNEIGMTALEFANKVSTRSIINPEEKKEDLISRVMREEFPEVGFGEVEHLLVRNQIYRKLDQTDREQYAAGVSWQKNEQLPLFNQNGFESPSHFFVGKNKKKYQQATFAEALFASKKQLALLEAKESAYAKAWDDVKAVRIKWSRWVETAQSLYDNAVKLGFDPEELTYEEAEKLAHENDARNEAVFSCSSERALRDMPLSDRPDDSR